MEISSDLKEKHETFQEEGYVRGGIMSLLQLGPFPASPLSLAGLVDSERLSNRVPAFDDRLK